MRQGSLRVLGMAALAASAVSAIAGQSSVYYSYFKQHKPLVLNQEVIALYRDPKLGAPTVPPALASEGGMRAALLPGWYYLDLPGGGTEGRVASLKHQTNGAVMPVFKDRFGYPLVFSPVINVRFTDKVSADEAAGILARYPGATFKKQAWIPNLYQLTLAEKDGYRILDVANELAALNQVRFASPNSLMSGRKNFAPNDPYWDRQWGMGSMGAYPGLWTPRLSIRANTAWDATVGQPSILTAVIDDGVQLNHPDLPIANAKDFLEVGDGGPRSQFDNHGTVMAGIIAARVNNAKGIAGVAGGTRIVSARIHASIDLTSFVFSPEAFYSGMLWIHQVGCRITNNSNTYGAEDALIDDAYYFGLQSGIIHFCAAGNNGETALEYPSDLEGTNAITGVFPNGILAPGASTGLGVMASAPGAFNVSTDRTGAAGYPAGFAGSVLSADGNYVLFDSAFNTTSFACAYASGVAALVLSVNPSLTPNQLRDLMSATCLDLFEPPGVTPDRIGYDDRWGWGMLDAAKAVSAALPAVVTVTPNPVKGGLKTKLRVTLAAAPVVDVEAIGSSDNQTAVPFEGVPMTVAAGTTFTTADVETRGVDFPVDVTMHVDLANLRRSVVLTVIPATLNRFVMNKTSVYGGETLAGQVELAGKAGPSGSKVSMSDNSAFVTPPAKVTIAPQQTKAVFNIATSRTTTTQSVTITATLAAVSMSQTLTVKPVLTDVQSLTLNPNVVMGGGRPIGTVKLTLPAPAGGAQIFLSDANTATSFVPSIVIPQGQDTGTFTVYTGPVGTTTYATIAATYFGVAKTANLTITPTLWVTSLTVTPSMVRGGFPAVGRIEIFSAAPAGGVPVNVTDTNSYVSTPLVVVVPAGKTWVEFVVTTYATNNTVTGDVRASYGGTTKIAPITVYK